LTDLELQHALDAYYREDESEPVLGAGSRVLDCCMGLVKVDRDRKVHLFHKTLREFLETQYDKEFPRSNLELGISCLNYLSMDKFSSGWCNDSRSVARLQKELPFADYASQHWAYHLKQYFNESKSGSLMDCNSSLQSLAMKFLQSRQKVQSAWQMYTLEGPLVISVSSLPGSSQGDLYIMVEKNEKKIEAYAPGEFSGLHLVCELGLHFLVEPLLALLGSSALENEDGSKRRPLYFAVASGDEKSIKKLLDAGANPDCRDLRNTSPLHIAARTGDTAILQLLLTSKQKVDLNARTEDYHEFRVHIRHADPRSGRTLSSPGMTALHFAAWNGHIASVKALCNCSELDANVTDTDGMSALHLAAKGKSPNHFEIVKMLAPAKDKSLTPFRGIDPQLRSYDGRTALHLAAKYMKLNIVEHLTSLEPIAWYIEDNDLLTVDETMAWFCENDEIAEKILSIKPSGGNRTRTPEECKILLQSISTRLRKRLNRSRVPAVHRCERIHEPVLPARRRWSLGQNQSPIDTSPINIPRRGENIQPALRSRPAVIDENSRRRKPHQALQRRYTVQTSTSSTSTSPKAVNSCPRLKSHSDFSSGTPCTCGLNKYLATVPGRIWNKRILEDTSQARQWPRFKCDPESDREESERKQSSPTKAAYLSRTDLAEDGLRANTGKERSSGSKEDSCCADSDVAEIDPKAETIRSMVLVLYIAVTCFICCRTWLGRG
jgi:ankyrin repeat protein